MHRPNKNSGACGAVASKSRGLIGLADGQAEDRKAVRMIERLSLLSHRLKSVQYGPLGKRAGGREYRGVEYSVEVVNIVG